MEKEFFMKEALKEAKKAYKKEEIPVGAVIVKDGEIIARGHNFKELKNKSIAHAEIIAIEKANKKLNAWRLENCEMYITLEPCMMCMGAIINSRIKKIYIGTLDPKTGACESVIKIENYKFNHVVEVETGILKEECEYILKDFFRMLRTKKRRKKMNKSSFSKKRIIHTFVVIFVLIIIMLIATLLMFKYQIEGEKNLPFNIKKINVISTAESNITQDEEGIWHAGILQKNDVFFTIEKNSNYKKEEAIKKISFENFQTTKSNEEIIINIYRPTTSMNSYKYTDEYKIENSLEYLGGLSTNSETLQINNQGGLVGFSITTDNLGEYIFSENEKLPSDGSLLAKAGVKEEEIKFNISFDLIIETESGKKFKSNIKLDLPTGNILEEGIGSLEDKELKDIVFKRF